MQQSDSESEISEISQTLADVSIGSKRSPLLDLPPEIREMIYKILFTSPTGSITFIPPKLWTQNIWNAPINDVHPGEMDLDLFQTCRLIYNECRDCLFKYNEVSIGALPYLEAGPSWGGHRPAIRTFPLDQGEGRTYFLNKHQKIKSKVTKVLLEVNFFTNQETGGLNPVIGSPTTFENTLNYLASFPNLQSIRIKAGGHRALRTLLKREDNYIEVLGTSFLASYINVSRACVLPETVQRIIEFKTNCSGFNSLKNSPHLGWYPDLLLESKDSPDNALQELSRAFRCKVVFNESVCYENGQKIKAATIAIGPLPTGSWVSSLRVNGEKKVPFYQRLRGTSGHVYEETAAKLFTASVMADISSIDVEKAIDLLRSKACPPFPETETSKEQLFDVLRFAQNCLAGVEGNFGQEERRKSDLESLHRGVFKGLRSALYARSDDVILRDHPSPVCKRWGWGWCSCSNVFDDMDGASPPDSWFTLFGLTDY